MSKFEGRERRTREVEAVLYGSVLYLYGTVVGCSLIYCTVV